MNDCSNVIRRKCQVWQIIGTNMSSMNTSMATPAAAVMIIMNTVMTITTTAAAPAVMNIITSMRMAADVAAAMIMGMLRRSMVGCC